MNQDQRGSATLIIVGMSLAATLSIMLSVRAWRSVHLSQDDERRAATAAAAWGAARVAAHQNAAFSGSLGPVKWKASPSGSGRARAEAVWLAAPSNKKNRKDGPKYRSNATIKP